MAEENRLVRIESKLDQLTEVVVELAKHDERITNLAKRQDRTEERLGQMENTVGKNSVITSIGQWLVAAIVGGVITFAIRTFLTGG